MSTRPPVSDSTGDGLKCRREKQKGISLEEYSNYLSSRCETDPLLRVLLEQLSNADRSRDHRQVDLVLTFIRRWESFMARRDARSAAR
jgi:hypothetical protein